MDRMLVAGLRHHIRRLRTDRHPTMVLSAAYSTTTVRSTGTGPTPSNFRLRGTD